MKYLSILKKYKFYICGGIVLLIILSGYIWATNVTASYKEPIKEELKEVKEVKEEKKETNKIRVDIKGEVEKPDVYEMSSDDRVIDLIKKAGGLKEEANTDIINLSKKLKDEDIIIIYSNNEIESFKKEEKSKYKVETKVLTCPDSNNSCINKETKIDEKDTKKESELKEDIKVNINEAGVMEFTSLPNIGEAKALKIIKYREENGNFESIEDLKNVSGIGDKLYEAIKDYITV